MPSSSCSSELLYTCTLCQLDNRLTQCPIVDPVSVSVNEENRQNWREAVGQVAWKVLGEDDERGRDHSSLISCQITGVQEQGKHQVQAEFLFVRVPIQMIEIVPMARMVSSESCAQEWFLKSCPGAYGEQMATRLSLFINDSVVYYL